VLLIAIIFLANAASSATAAAAVILVYHSSRLSRRTQKAEAARRLVIDDNVLLIIVTINILAITTASGIASGISSTSPNSTSITSSYFVGISTISSSTSSSYSISTISSSTSSSYSISTSRSSIIIAIVVIVFSPSSSTFVAIGFSSSISPHRPRHRDRLLPSPGGRRVIVGEV
jgi:hypothetical protein